MDFDDVFRDLDKAVVLKQQVTCYKQEVNGKIRWVIEIDDPHTTERFESKLKAFFDRMRGKHERADV